MNLREKCFNVPVRGKKTSNPRKSTNWSPLQKNRYMKRSGLPSSSLTSAFKERRPLPKSRIRSHQLHTQRNGKKKNPILQKEPRMLPKDKKLNSRGGNPIQEKTIVKKKKKGSQKKQINGNSQRKKGRALSSNWGEKTSFFHNPRSSNRKEKKTVPIGKGKSIQKTSVERQTEKKTQ